MERCLDRCSHQRDWRCEHSIRIIWHGLAEVVANLQIVGDEAAVLSEDVETDLDAEVDTSRIQHGAPITVSTTTLAMNAE